MTEHVNTYPLQTAAKLIGIGSKKLFALLREQQVLDQANVPYQKYIDQGYFKVHRGNWNHPTIGTKLYARPLVTVRGVEWLGKLIGKDSNND